MERFLQWLEEKFMPPMAKLSEQRHLRAIRDGIISTLPLLIVGSFFIMFAMPPVDAWRNALAASGAQAKILIPFRLTTGLMSVYAVYGMGYSLAKSYKLDGVSGGVLSLSAFLLTTIPLNVDGVMAAATKAGVQGAAGMGWILPMGNLGGAGMFVAILCMIFSVETLRILKKYKITLTMPEQVPESVARSFEALIPAAVIILIVWFIRVWSNVDIHAKIMKVFQPLLSATDSLGGVVVPVLLITLLWAAGIHGVSVVGSVLRPFWLTLLDANANAVAAGQALPHVAPEQFFQWLIWIGGSGATLGLCALMCFSKSEYLKKVGRFSIIPGIFNINEPIIFGTPLVMNPILAIPFVIGPTITGIISYFVVKANLVGRFSINAPWTLPAPMGAYVATNGDLRVVFLVLFNIALTTLIYYPFFKMYERKMIKEEAANVEASKGIQA